MMDSEDNHLEDRETNIIVFSKNDTEDLSGTPESDEDESLQRRGNVWTATSHIITAVIGSGVLSLSWSVGQMGWIAGPLVLIAFSFVTYYTAVLLIDCHRSPVTGRRNHSYMDAVRDSLGQRKVFWCGVVQYSNLVGTTIGYTITASISMAAVQRSNCFHNRSHAARCYASNNPYMVAFGVCQIICSQIPDFNRIWWLSIVAAVMSFFYAGVGFGLGVGKTFVGGHPNGSVTGSRIGTGTGDIIPAEKTWHVFQSLGNVAFAFSFSTVLIEIQDTLRGPPNYPPVKKTMRMATFLGITITALVYVTVASSGYLAFGSDVPANMLTGFGFFNPFWLLDLANIAVAIHLVGAYQVFAQPVFSFVEHKAREVWSIGKFIDRESRVTIRFYGTLAIKLNWFRIVWRTSFVVMTTVVAMLLPFFTAVTALIGAFCFWPLTVYFPVEMYIKATKIEAWSRKWAALQAFSLACLIVSIAAGIGAVEGIKDSLTGYKPFGTTY